MTTHYSRLLVAGFAVIAGSSLGLGQTATITSVSAANYAPIVAPDSVVSGWGTSLASALTVATEGNPITLPTTLDNVQLSLVDSSKATSTPTLYMVSPSQINYVLPSTVALGAATLSVQSPSGAAQGTVLVSNVSPGLFTFNGMGTGVPAAQVIRLTADGNVTYESPAQSGTTNPSPISIGSDQVYLALYGTGIRRHSPNPVFVLINGVSVPALYAGPQSQYPGLDQVNVGPLPTSLAGAGTTNLVLTVDGVPANTVQIAFQ